MRLGRPVSRQAVLVAVLVAPTLNGCGLLSGGSTAEEALEYLPADTFRVRFSDRAAMAERLGVDDVDPRDVGDRELENYVAVLGAFNDGTAVATTELTSFVRLMRDAPLNDFDIEWEARAWWGDHDEPDGAATVWKVGDDVDFEALGGDLEEKGFVKGEASGLPVFTGDPSLADPRAAVIGGVYPSRMHNVLVDEDEQLVVIAAHGQSLDDVAAVITDHSDSLADDGGMDDLLEVTDDDPELAWLATGGSTVCPGGGRRGPAGARALYDGVGTPEARAFLVSGDDAEVVLALRYAGEDEAADDLEAREDLVDEGVDLRTSKPLSEFGDFSLERDDDLLRIEMDYEDGPLEAVRVERAGGGPGACGPGTGR